MTNKTTFDCDDRTKTRLQKIMKRTGISSMAEVIRNSVAILERASKGDNAKIIIKNDNETVEVMVTK